MNTDPDVVGGRLRQVLPAVLLLQLAKFAHAAVVIENVQDDVLDHAARQVGVDVAYDRHIRAAQDRPGCRRRRPPPRR